MDPLVLVEALEKLGYSKDYELVDLELLPELAIQSKRAQST
jgi:hypothetical protein